MKEEQPINYQHLKALHYLVGVPFEESEGARKNKERILESMGFSKGTNVAIRREFVLPRLGTDTDGIKEYLTWQLANGRFVSMLFKDGYWETMGGSPVTYIMTKDDLNGKLTFDHERLVGACAHNGAIILIDHKINLQTYSRRRSMPSELSGFTNHDGVVPVRLGGGFRLQVDDVTFIDRQPYMTLSGYFSFNDMGSRVLALSCKEDSLVPRYETSFSLKVDSGQLIFPDSGGSNDKVLISTNNAGVVVNQMLSILFKRDGEAISNLLRGLLSVRPSMKVHQLEGIFSIPSETEISAEIIDFDGLDAFDISCRKPILSPSERLTRGQLIGSGFLLTDPESLLSFIPLQLRIQRDIKSLIDSPIITDDIKGEVSRHFSNSPDIFTRELTGAVKLGRLLGYLDVDWENTESPQVKFFRNGDNTLILISIEGFDIAFWKKKDTLVDCTDIKRLTRELSHITGTEITGVYLSLLREGD